MFEEDDEPEEEGGGDGREEAEETEGDGEGGQTDESYPDNEGNFKVHISCVFVKPTSPLCAESEDMAEASIARNPF